MMATDLEKIKKDGSKKNQSSLAFITTVSVPGKRSYTALFTGDANATDTFLPLYTQAGGPIEVDVMKGMRRYLGFFAY